MAEPDVLGGTWPVDAFPSVNASATEHVRFAAREEVS